VLNIPSPDARPCVGCGSASFNFTRLGVRVPMLAISPWVAAGAVLSAPAENGYDHGSIAATLRAVFPGFPGPLTARDAWAQPLTAALSLSAPRTDAPAQLPSPAGASPALAGLPRDGAGPVNHLQDSLLLLAEGAAREAAGRADLDPASIRADLEAAGARRSEADAGRHARKLMHAMLARVG
jgi:phospholipase C